MKQAKLWGKIRYKHKNTATLETVISAERDMILNLNSRQGIIKLEAYEKVFRRKNSDIVFEHSEEVWVVMRNFPIASIFDKNNNLQNLGFIHKDKQVDYNQYSPQVCVKNLDVIVLESIRNMKKAQPKITKLSKKPFVKKGSLNYDAFSK